MKSILILMFFDEKKNGWKTKATFLNRNFCIEINILSSNGLIALNFFGHGLIQ